MGSLGGPLGGLLGPLGASWGLPGGLLGPPGSLLGPRARKVTSDTPFEPPLGAVLGASWAVLGPSWAVLGPSWGHLGPSWGGFRGLLGRHQRREGRNVVYARNIRFSNRFGRILPFGAILGALLEAFWGVLRASWAVWMPSWASWNDLSAIRGPLEPSWGRFGRLQGLSWSSRANP